MMMMSPLHKAACDSDVSATEYFRPSQLVDLIHQNTKSFGVFHPGYRAAHANGRFYAGTSTPTLQAKTLSRAFHLQQDPVPVTSRFSFGSGNVDESLAHNVLNVLDSEKRYREREFMDLLRLDNGEPLVKGKNVTGFSWLEEVAAQRADAVPFSLQDALERRGCKYSVADNPFGTHVVTDGRLITGQNPASARAVGEAVVAALQER
jgi:putative intracellular protease/amidase